MVSLKIAAAAAILLDEPCMTCAFSTQGNNGKAPGTDGFNIQITDSTVKSPSRRSLLLNTVAAATFASIVTPAPSFAAAECFSDCLKVRYF
jgi:hypothetical protein